MGTKADLRNDTATIERLKAKGMNFVTHEQGIACQKSINVVKYTECSALTLKGLKVSERDGTTKAQHGKQFGRTRDDPGLLYTCPNVVLPFHPTKLLSLCQLVFEEAIRAVLALSAPPANVRKRDHTCSVL